MVARFGRLTSRRCSMAREYRFLLVALLGRLRYATFLPDGLLIGGYFSACFAALTAAQRFLVAAMIAFRPAALSFRFLGFAATTCSGSATCFSLAYLARCARAIFRLTATRRRPNRRIGRETEPTWKTLDETYGGL
jgi:hypothetical protein